jgi:16S rRNA processing protein RimM
MDSTEQSSNKVLIAKIVGLHALKGEVRVLPYGDIDWINGESLYPVTEGTKPTLEPKSMKVSSIRPHKGVVLVTFKGISTIEEAESLVGLELYVEEEKLPELKPGEYYHQDLIGMEVLSVSGDSLGELTDVITTKANDVYQVTGPKGEWLLPALKEVIVSVEVENKKMVVKPEGYEPEGCEPNGL